MDIKGIKVKLKAYTKGILPTKVSQLENDSDYVVDTQDLEHVYVRRKGEWVILDKEIIKAKQDKPGINVVYNYNQETHENIYTISARQEDLTQEEFNHKVQQGLIEDDVTYFVDEAPKPILNLSNEPKEEES